MNEQMIEAQDVLDAPLPVVNPANGTPMPTEATPRKPVVFVQTDAQFPEVTEEPKLALVASEELARKPTLH